MLFIDKYNPKTINDVFFHKDIYDMLEVMANDNSIPHLLFHGSHGSGKNTMVNIFMEMLFGKSVNNIKHVKYIVSGSGSSESEEEFKQSYHHILIEPKGNNHDRYLIHDVIKVYVSKAMYNLVETKHKFKIVIIKNVDVMSESVQFSLRRTIERYSDQCRFIIIANSISKVINPIISRCRCICVKSPSITEVIDYSMHISIKENIKLTLDQLAHITGSYNGNIKEVLWKMQLYKLNTYYLENIYNNMSTINELLETNNIYIDFKSIYNEVKDADDKNIFIYKNINRFINTFGNKMFNKIKDTMKNKISEQRYHFFFMNISDFLYKSNMIINKKKKYSDIDKKTKLDDIICKIGALIYDTLSNIRLLDPLLSKDYIIRELYSYIKTCDMKMMNNIRNIIFDLLITNISGTDIIKSLSSLIMNDEKININKKLKILNICREADYGIIKGRREINQFDNLIINIITIMLN